MDAAVGLAKKPKAAKKALGKSKKALAIHGKTTDGKHHLVGIGNLRVIIVPDADYWFAQGLEIDYAAQGTSLEDAKREFEKGLFATVAQHLRIHGGIEALLQVAPTPAWAPFLKDASAYKGWLSQVSLHEVVGEEFPFSTIDYYIPQDVA